MKICFIGNIAPHYRAEIFSKMCKELSCDFYFGQPFGRIANIKALPVSFFSTHAEMLQNIIIPFSGAYWQKGSIRLLHKNYDILIITGDISCISTWVLMIINRILFKKRIILWGHGWYGRENSLKKMVKKIYYALSDRVLVYGDRAIQLMLKEGFKSSKLFAIHNSLSYDEQSKLFGYLPLTNPIQKHFQNNYPAIVFSGRLTSPKRIDMIIAAVSQLCQKHVFLNCILIGDGPEKRKLEDLVKNNDLYRYFWFYGACYDEQIIGSFYWNAVACVSPGYIGLTAIHSLTYGCPVITHNDFLHQMPESEAIIPGITGDFFEYDNVQSLQDTIKKWIDISSNDRESIRSACQKSIREEWTADYQIKILRTCCTF